MKHIICRAGHYYLRWTLPPELRAILNSREIKRSLNTDNKYTALKTALPYLELIDTLKAITDTQQLIYVLQSENSLGLNTKGFKLTSAQSFTPETSSSQNKPTPSLFFKPEPTEPVQENISLKHIIDSYIHEKTVANN